jgi:hypothetical protein
MKHRNYLVFTLLAIAASTQAFAAEGYACVSEHQAGLAFDKATKQWSATTFKANQILVIQKPNARQTKLASKAVWIVSEIDSDLPLFVCEKEFTDEGWLRCEGLSSFTFNKVNGRFLSTHQLGYVTDGLEGFKAFGPEGSLNPTVTGGRCKPI